MNILIYSDGTRVKSLGLACSIVLTETHYVGLVVKKYTVKDAADAELRGILQALEFLESRSDRIDIDTVLICTDAEYHVSVYNGIISCGYIPNHIKYRDRWMKIMTICKKHNVSFLHMASHQFDHNPNKVCDIMGRVHRRCGTDMLVRG